MGKRPKIQYLPRNHMWPDCLSHKTIKQLEFIAKEFSGHHVPDSRLLNSDMRRDAKALSRQALEFLKKIRIFEENYSLAADENGAINAAREKLATHFEGDELKLAEAGFSRFSIQYPLFGLHYHMQEILIRFPGKNGRPRNWVRDVLREYVMEAFKKEELEVLPHSNEFKQAVSKIYSLAGIAED